MIEIDDIFLGLQQKIKTLTAERTALETADAPPEQIAERTRLIQIVQGGVEYMAGEERKTREAATRRQKWQIVYDACGAAKRHYEEICAEIKKYNADLLVLESAVSFAQGRFYSFNSRPLNFEDFPTPHQRAAWNQQQKALEADTKKCREAVRQFKEKEPDIARRYQAATQEYSQLAFQERRLRDPDPEITGQPTRVNFTIPSAVPPNRGIAV
jgi:hypothetical protein